MLSSVTNALRVLEYLVEAKEAGVSEIGRHFGITVGTAHRLVTTLVAAGFAEQNPSNRRYQPGPKLLLLANKMRADESVRDLAHDHLTRLMKQVGETTNLAVLRDNKVLYIDKVTSDQAFGIEARVGSRLPAYCTALGKVLVAGLNEEEFEAYLAEVRDEERENGQPPPPDASWLRQEIENARVSGFAEDHGEFLPDVFCAAAPVRNEDDDVVAAISVSAPRSRFETQRDELVRHLRETAEALSAELKRIGAHDVHV